MWRGLEEWSLGQDDEPVDCDAFSDGLVPCRSDITGAIVIAISRNVDNTAARLVGCLLSLAHREVDPALIDVLLANARRRPNEVITEQTRRLVIADHHPIEAKPSKGPRSRPPLRPVQSIEPISAPPSGTPVPSGSMTRARIGEKYWCCPASPSTP